jgi:predicted deacylase
VKNGSTEVVAEPFVTDRLDLDSLPRGRVHRLRIELAEDGIGRPIAVPVLCARGSGEGPVVGLTAAVHGNELNGIPIIHRLLREHDPQALQGTLVAVPVVNVPGFLDNQRTFHDGKDLNRCFPGREDGASSEVYAFRFLDRIVKRFEYLIDLHTASFGRVNSLYVRADMTRAGTAQIARLLHPQIIVHNAGDDGTLRSAAAELGIHAVTVEVGDPNRFQRGLIRSSRLGIESVLAHLGMLEPSDDAEGDEAIECIRSYWLYTDAGGILEVFPSVAGIVREGQVIARLTDVYGGTVREYRAPEDGVVVGKTDNPVAHTGARILHLGIVG